MKIIKLLILLAFFSSCAMFEHRDFERQMGEYQFQNNAPMFQAHEDFMVISGDTGRYSRTDREIRGRTPASGRTLYEQKYQDSLNRELSFLESKMTDDEYYQFDKIRGDIGGTSEQIYFLRLSERERRSYLKIRNLSEQTTQVERKPAYVNNNRYLRRPVVSATDQYMPVSKDDVSLGMSMERVMENWGNPERRDVAGDPKFRNERWAFRKNGSVKYIYFESGVVQGWSEE